MRAQPHYSPAKQHALRKATNNKSAVGSALRSYATKRKWASIKVCFYVYVFMLIFIVFFSFSTFIILISSKLASEGKSLTIGLLVLTVPHFFLIVSFFFCPVCVRMFSNLYFYLHHKFSEGNIRKVCKSKVGPQLSLRLFVLFLTGTLVF